MEEPKEVNSPMPPLWTPPRPATIEERVELLTETIDRLEEQRYRRTQLDQMMGAAFLFGLALGYALWARP